MISQINSDYLSALIEYNKILKQRNSLLKLEQNIKQKLELIEIFDVQLEQPATIIFNARKNFCEKIIPLFQHYYFILSNKPEEQVALIYKSQLHDTEMASLLKQNIEKDIQTEYTNYGIHKDDLLFTLNHQPIRYFASQGQQKTYLTSLKLAFTELIGTLKQYPLILLDDIFDKLDDFRVNNLLTIIQQSPSQAFITHTNTEKINQWMKKSTDYCIFELDNGKIIHRF